MENKTYIYLLIYLLIILTGLAKPKDIIKASLFIDVFPFFPRVCTH